MADFYAFQKGGGSPSRNATTPVFCGFDVGKLLVGTNAILRLPAIFGKPIWGTSARLKRGRRYEARLGEFEHLSTQGSAS